MTTVSDVIISIDGKATIEMSDGSVVIRDLLTTGGGTTTIANDLLTNDPLQALSAAQGVVLKTAVDSKAGTSTATTSADGLMSSTDKTKLNGISTGATANSTDAILLDRANHTGTQAISTVTNLQTTLDGKQPVTGIPGAFTSRTLTTADNGKNLICASAQTATVNTGLGSGFGVSFKGAISFTGTATVNDVRTTGATNPWCALLQTATDTYDVVGTKA